MHVAVSYALHLDRSAILDHSVAHRLCLLEVGLTSGGRRGDTFGFLQQLLDSLLLLLILIARTLRDLRVE